MKSVRAEVLNVLLCLVLGAAIGGVMLLVLDSAPAPADKFEAEPQLAMEEDAGLEAMQRIDDEHQRRHALFNVMSRLAMTNLDEALSHLPTDATHDSVLSEWITLRLQSTRPDVATRAATAFFDNDARSAAIAASARFWRRRDAAQAGQWLRSNLDDGIAAKLAAVAMQDDPAFIARVLLDQKSTPSIEACLARLLQEWFATDSAEALRFAETMPPTRLTPDFLKTTVRHVLVVPKERVAEWMGTLPAASQSRLAAELIHELPERTSLANALGWLTATKALELSPADAAQWFATLTTHAPADAQSALDTISSGPLRDECISGCVRAVGARDRFAAMDLAHEIDNTSARNAALRGQWLAWMHENNPAALEWLVSPNAPATLGQPLQGELIRRYHNSLR